MKCALLLMSLPCLLLQAEWVTGEEKSLRITANKNLSGIDKVEVYLSGDVPKPKLLATGSVGEIIKLPHPGPFDIWAVPRHGIGIRVANRLDIPNGRQHTLALESCLGTLEVYGDRFPRAEAIVVTPKGDPGPGEKGHVAVQRVNDYRLEMVIPEGQYSVWVVPANGSKAQRVVDDVRILAGRRERIE